MASTRLNLEKVQYDTIPELGETLDSLTKKQRELFNISKSANGSPQKVKEDYALKHSRAIESKQTMPGSNNEFPISNQTSARMLTKPKTMMISSNILL